MNEGLERDRLYAIVRAVSRVFGDPVFEWVRKEPYVEAEVVHRVTGAFTEAVEEPVWDALRKAEKDAPYTGPPFQDRWGK